jgi:hypothetical protein
MIGLRRTSRHNLASEVTAPVKSPALSDGQADLLDLPQFRDGSNRFWKSVGLLRKRTLQIVKRILSARPVKATHLR